MRLMLLRHAKSARPVGVDDHDRPLSDRGREASQKMGTYMAREGLVADLAVVSTAHRTQETWNLARPAFDRDIPLNSERRAYAASRKKLLEVVRETAPDVATLILVGHNPGIQDLALGLIDSAEPQELARLKDKLPTAGLVVIDFTSGNWSDVSEHTGALERFVTPGSIAQ